LQLGVIVLNREMRITNMSRVQEDFLQRLDVWLSWLEAIGMSVAELVPDDSIELWESITEAVLGKGETYRDARRTYQTSEGDMLPLGWRLWKNDF
jgi:type II secretory pathway component PulL